ncbi:hypothetical protein BV22DRAFT_288556 [Leucogyrophana mollusca]|uniref:Uncharacterized protein n=1 Tax=Leucogyrophana mollusca TaxID=85980 RepID=A0ACB8BR09_9AGAM|nr:hypothetical protein BV22DRAFT_288556 [Leucogyrophana mollusca]
MDRSVLDTSSNMAGVFASMTVFLILTMQVWLYFRKSASQDARWIKGIAASVWIVQAVQIAMSSHMAYCSMRSYDNDVQAVTDVSVDWAIYVGTTSLTAFLVHVLFVWRLHILGKCLNSRWNAAIPVGLVTLAAQASGLFSVIQILRLDQSDPGGLAVLMEWSIPLWLGLVALGDILIATSLCALLYQSRTGLRSTDRIVKRLTLFVVQTGLITSIVAMVTVGIWAAAGFDTRHLYMSFPMGGLYATYTKAGGHGDADNETFRSIEFTLWGSAPSNSPADVDDSLSHSDGPIDSQINGLALSLHALESSELAPGRSAIVSKALERGARMQWRRR